MIPFLLNNSSTWINIKKRDIERLTKLQNLFLFSLLRVNHCPTPIMYFDLAMLSISSRILKEKLVLFHHILCLPEGAVARSILEIQQRLHLRGLNQEVEDFLVEHEISNAREFTKSEWKHFVSRKIRISERNQLIEKAKKYKKIDYLSLSCEEFELKDYFCDLDLARARIKFRDRANCMSTCKRHYPSEENIVKMFLCESCDSDKVDNISHWRQCSAFSHFRQDRDLGSDTDLISYYQDIINLRRSEMNK